MDWWVEMGVWDVRPEEVSDPAELSATNPLVSGVGALGHTISFQHLAHSGVHLLGRLERIDNGVIYTDDQVLTYIKDADEFSTGQKAIIDEYIVQGGLDAVPTEPDPADEPLTPEATIEFRTELDLRGAGVSTVIWSTGFTADFSWLNVPVMNGAGRPVHHNGISDTPGIYFIGFPWLSKRKSGVVLGIEEDANRIAQHAHLRLNS